MSLSNKMLITMKERKPRVTEPHVTKMTVKFPCSVVVHLLYIISTHWASCSHMYGLRMQFTIYEVIQIQIRIHASCALVLVDCGLKELIFIHVLQKF